MLVAKPFWEENDYKRSVVLVIEHGEEGSVGLIINKPSNLDIHSAVNELNLTLPLFYGGPFDKNLIIFLHNQPQIPDCYYLGNGLYLGGDYDILKFLIQDHKLDLHKIRFCAGNVEWAPGQLEKEIKEGKWWSAEMDAHEYFSIQSDSLWSYKLIAEGHMYGIFEDYPDPSLS